jgi:hypothetical protein
VAELASPDLALRKRIFELRDKCRSETLSDRVDKAGWND